MTGLVCVLARTNCINIRSLWQPMQELEARLDSVFFTTNKYVSAMAVAAKLITNKEHAQLTENTGNLQRAANATFSKHLKWAWDVGNRRSSQHLQLTLLVDTVNGNAISLWFSVPRSDGQVFDVFYLKQCKGSIFTQMIETDDARARVLCIAVVQKQIRILYRTILDRRTDDVLNTAVQLLNPSPCDAGWIDSNLNMNPSSIPGTDPYPMPPSKVGDWFKCVFEDGYPKDPRDIYINFFRAFNRSWLNVSLLTSEIINSQETDKTTFYYTSECDQSVYAAVWATRPEDRSVHFIDGTRGQIRYGDNIIDIQISSIVYTTDRVPSGR